MFGLVEDGEQCSSYGRSAYRTVPDDGNIPRGWNLYQVLKAAGYTPSQILTEMSPDAIVAMLETLIGRRCIVRIATVTRDRHKDGLDSDEQYSNVEKILEFIPEEAHVQVE